MSVPMGIGTPRKELMRRCPTTWVVLLEDGCDIADSCCECPLSRCRFDDPDWFRRSLYLARDLAMAELMDAEGFNPALSWSKRAEAVAERFGVKARTVFRAMDHARRNGHSLLPEEARALAVAQGFRGIDQDGRGRDGHSPITRDGHIPVVPRERKEECPSRPPVGTSGRLHRGRPPIPIESGRGPSASTESGPPGEALGE